MGEEDVFDSGQEVRPNRVAFSKLGDYIVGYFSGSKEVPGKKGPLKLYELKGVSGQYHFAATTDDGNGNKVVKIDEQPTVVNPGEYYIVFGGKDQIDSLFHKAKLGQKIGLRFEKATPSKTPGNSPFKEFKTVMWDEMDPDPAGITENDVAGAGI